MGKVGPAEGLLTDSPAVSFEIDGLSTRGRRMGKEPSFSFLKKQCQGSFAPSVPVAFIYGAKGQGILSRKTYNEAGIRSLRSTSF